MEDERRMSKAYSEFGICLVIWSLSLYHLRYTQFGSALDGLGHGIWRQVFDI